MQRKFEVKKEYLKNGIKFLDVEELEPIEERPVDSNKTIAKDGLVEDITKILKEFNDYNNTKHYGLTRPQAIAKMLREKCNDYFTAEFEASIGGCGVIFKIIPKRLGDKK